MAISRSEQKRKKILLCAKKIFLNHGYQNTSIDDIVSMAGGSKQSVYLHFRSKQGLYEAVVHEMAKEADTGFSLEHCDADSVDGVLRDFAHSYLNHVLSQDIIKLLRVIIAQSQVDLEGATIFRHFGPDQHYSQLAAYFDNLVVKNQLAIDNTDLAAKQFLGMLRGDMQAAALTIKHYKPGKKDIKESIDMAVRSFLASYGK